MGIFRNTSAVGVSKTPTISSSRSHELAWDKEGQFENLLSLCLICIFSSFSSHLSWIMSSKSLQTSHVTHTHTYTFLPCIEQLSYHFLRENHRFLWSETKVDVSCLLVHRLPKQKKKKAICTKHMRKLRWSILSSPGRAHSGTTMVIHQHQFDQHSRHPREQILGLSFH